MATYHIRDVLLREMGYNSYRQYLGSTLWKGIRGRGFKALGRVCYLCGGKAELLHHYHYEPVLLEGHTLLGLVPLCEKCHHKVEWRKTRKGRFKRKLVHAQRYLLTRIGMLPVPTTPEEGSVL